MSTGSTRIERRATQRFDLQQPVRIRLAAGAAEGNGFTQDLSARGVSFYTDFAVAEGAALELTLVMPSEITLGENMRVRCRARVLRVTSTGVGDKRIVAAVLEGYEYLPATDTVEQGSRAPALHEPPPQDDSGASVHTFEWRGTAAFASH
jgi:hypothetical protein